MKDSSITALVAAGGSGQTESSDYFSEQWRKIKGKKGGRKEEIENKGGKVRT